MKNIDVLIVRLLPFLLYVIVGVNMINAWNGIDGYPFNLFHSNSAIYAFALYLVSLSNKRYHCVWNRVMYVFLIVTPVLNFIDSCFEITHDVYVYFYIAWGLYIATGIATAYLAIRHLLKIRKLRKEKEFIHNGRR